jgi:Flp pilus assembly protein TadD
MWTPDELDFVRDEIKELPGIDKKPRGGIGKFGSRIGHAVSLCFKEKEIFVFVLLQWAAIGIAYLLWVQMLRWIPEEVWRSAANSKGSSIADWVLLAWSVVCVGVAAFPVGILTGCMGAAHFLHKQGRESTIATCLKHVLPQSWSLWTFHWIDGWITVNQIADRLPRKNGWRTPAERALSETLYYAWKLGVSGVLPSIVTGNSLIASARNSVVFVKHNFLEVAALRAGYSALCWVVGIGAYIGALLFFLFFPANIAPAHDEVYGHIYTFYFWAGVPIIIAAGMVMLFLRPVYVLALCDLYSDHLKSRNKKVDFPANPTKATSAMVAFAVLCVLVGVVFMYRIELGVMDMLATPYGQQRLKLNDPSGQYQAAMTHYEAQRYKPAAAGFKQTLVLRPNDALVHARLGFSYLQLSLYEDAIPHMKRAVELDPSDHITWNNLGLVHERVGRPREGIEPLRTAAELRPKDAVVLSNYGLILRKAGRLDEALIPLLKAASLDPDDPAPHFHLGMVYAAKGDRSAAQKELAIVRERDASLAGELEAAIR